MRYTGYGDTMDWECGECGAKTEIRQGQSGGFFYRCRDCGARVFVDKNTKAHSLVAPLFKASLPKPTGDPQ